MEKAKYHVIDTLKHKSAVLDCCQRLIENTKPDDMYSLLNLAMSVLSDGKYENYCLTLNSMSENLYALWCGDASEIDPKEFVLAQLALNCMYHDMSKIEMYDEYIAYRDVVYKLAGLEYGTPEHTAAIEELDYGFSLHVKNNKHHPESYEMHLEDMNLLELAEMVIDWCAAAICRGFKFRMSSVDKIKKEELGLSDTLVELIKANVRLILPEDKIEE